jgi:hypothetical protein
MMPHCNWRALSLSLIGALSLLGFSAVSAQAGKFKIDDKELLALITGAQVGTGLLLIPGRNLTIKCEAAQIEAESEIINGNEALARVEFSKCLAFQHKSPFSHINCTIDNFLAITRALPILHGGERYVLFEPDPPSTLLTIMFFLGTPCPLPEENPVHGSLLALVDGNNTVQPLLLFKHELASLLGDEIKFGGFAATTQTTLHIEAVGAHKGARIGIL